MPVDFLFPTLPNQDKPKRVDQYIGEIKDRLTEALQEARKQTTVEAHAQKRIYDRRANAVLLLPGDSVWVKADSYQGRRKIKDKWESGTWTVVRSVAGSLPTYVITNEHGRTRTVHRNRLFLIASSATGAVPVKVNTCRLLSWSASDVPCDDSQGSENDSVLDVYGLDITLFQVKLDLLEHFESKPASFEMPAFWQAPAGGLVDCYG